MLSEKTIFLRTGHNYDRDAASLEAGTFNDEPSATKQSFAEECDINNIVERFGLTGELPTDVRMPQYADFEESVDYHSAMNAVVAARESFMTMPAHIRARFGNDPGAFVEFCSDSSNYDEAKKLGLVVPQNADVIPPKEEKKVDGTVST